MITATGLGSGLDISGLVTQLVEAERAGSDLQLNRESAKLNARISALGAFKGSVSAFQGSLAGLYDLSNFSKNSATSSDNSTIAVTAGTGAIANNYSVDVTQLAKSHALASGVFNDATTSAIGTGSITFRFGTTDYTSGTDTYNGFTLNPDSSSATVDIDSSNNTLEGIMNAINDADIGVRAAIVNDGSGFRLLMTSEATGEENSLEIIVDDDDLDDTDTGGLSAFTFNAASTNMDQTVAAGNAEFTVNGLAMSHAANEVNETIPGLNLSLKQVTGETVDITVSQNTAAVTNAALAFVGGYNQLRNTINAYTGYNADTKSGGVLLGDFTVRAIKSQMDSILYSPVAGISGDFTALSEIGFSTDENGKLVLDQTRLKEVLASNPADVKKIFSAFGEPTDQDIQYKSATSDTLTGNYAVNITALATAGTLTGSGVLPDFPGVGTLTIDADNDNLTVEVDGIDAGEITITNGVYSTGDDLAAEIQSQINGTTAMRDAGKTVAVSYDSVTDSFSITSNTVGNASTVNILAVDTNSATDLGFSVVNGTDGTDVSGTIDGVAGIGAGNLLTADEGSDAHGLGLIIGGVTTGSRGNVNFSRGLASQLDLLIDQILDTEGALASRLDSINTRIESVEKRRAEMELRWVAVEERYLSKFNALDSLLSSLQFTSNSLNDQLANLPGPYKKISRS